MIAALSAKQALRKQLVHVEQWQDGKKVSVPHVLVGGRLLRLTDAQITDLKESQ